MMFCYLQSPITASIPSISAFIVGKMRRRSLQEVMVTVVRWKESGTSSQQAMVFCEHCERKKTFLQRSRLYIPSDMFIAYVFGEKYFSAEKGIRCTRFAENLPRPESNKSNAIMIMQNDHFHVITIRLYLSLHKSIIVSQCWNCALITAFDLRG